MANQNLKFKYPCFIRKNSEKLRYKLEDLGYTLNIFDEDGLGQYLCVGGKTYISACSIEDNIRLSCVDCDINDELFLAVAAIRDDTDYGQWFKIPVTKVVKLPGFYGQVVGMDGNQIVQTGWNYIKYDKRDSRITESIKFMTESGEKFIPSKMTIEELKEYFKNE